MSGIAGTWPLMASSATERICGSVMSRKRNNMARKLIYTKRCSVCKKIIRSFNKSDLCCWHNYNGLQRIRREKIKKK